jgi:hypothetical protein
MGLIWIISFLIWGTISVAVGNEQFTLRVNLKPAFLITIANLLWFFLLTCIIIFVVKICWLYRQKYLLEKLNGENKKRVCFRINSLTLASNVNCERANQENKFRIKDLFKLSNQMKLFILTFIYWIQWYILINLHFSKNLNCLYLII